MIEYNALKAVQLQLRTFLTAYGILGYMLVLRPLWKFRKTTFSSPFYTICIALACSEIVQLLLNVVTIVTDTEIEKLITYNIVKTFLDRISFYGTECHQLLIAIERSVAVFLPTSSKLSITNTRITLALALTWMGIIGTNFCVLTKDICPYMWYPNTTTVFYDFSNPGSVLHNRVTDLGLQPIILITTILLYLMSGLKVASVRRKVEGHISQAQRTVRLDHVLLLQGFMVTVPMTIVATLYQIQVRIQNISTSAMEGFDFFVRVLLTFGICFTPYLHILFNNDVRAKVLESWVPKPPESMESKSTLVNLKKEQMK